MVKKEDGTATNYVFYLMAISFILIIFYYMIIAHDASIVKEMIYNGVQVCMNHIVGNTDYSAENPEEEEIYIERELSRLHVITTYDDTIDTLTTDEIYQLNKLSKKYSNLIKKWFSLDDDNIPRGNVMEYMSDGSFHIDNLIFYEAAYNSTGDISNYIIYTVTFNSNNVPNSILNSTKTICSVEEAKEHFCNALDLAVPTEEESDFFLGSAITSKISYTIKGPNSPTEKVVFPPYVVNKTVAVDVVKSTDDDRNPDIILP